MSEPHPGTSCVYGLAAWLAAIACVLAASPFGCATPPDAPPVTPADPGTSPRVLATFVGHVDTATGTLTFDDPGMPGQIAQALTNITINPTTTPVPDTVEMITTASHFDTDASGAGPCGGANRFCADVTLRSRFTSDLVDIYVQLDTLIPAGTSVYNGDPPSLGTSDTFGLWSYGQLPTYDGSSLTTTSRNWGFTTVSGARFTFTGRVLADVSTAVNAPHAIAPMATSGVTSQRPTMHWALGSGSDGARVEICRDRTCTRIVTAFDTTGATHGTPTTALLPGLYFWRARGLDSRTMGVGAEASPVWEFTVGARSAPVDTSWGTMLDVNGDGYADAVVGAPNADAVYVYMGSAAGLAATPFNSLTGPDGPNGSFGVSVASAGDVNGDGYGDLIVGADQVGSNTGRAYVYLGSSMGLSGVHLPAIVGPSGANGSFGNSVASAGDVNGDGYADVVIGAYHANGQRGRAYVYYGGTMGLPSSPSVMLNGTTSATASFGQAVASAGDVNGDGVADLAVGASGDFGSGGGGRNTGRVYVYLGNTTGLANSPTILYGLDGFNAFFGASVACAGDTNGDGYADLIVGANNAGASGTGRAYVFAGGTSGLAASPSAMIEGPDGPAGDFAAAVAGAGDTNGDGYADVIVGAVGGSDGSDLGHAYLYRGPVAPAAATPATVLASPDGIEDLFGTSVAGVGDIDADGFADVMVGAPSAPWSDATGAGPGRAYVYPGHAAGLATTPATMFTGPDGDDGAFGTSVATRTHDAPYARLCS